LGNARTFLVNWALAKKNDWSIVLRVEDLDTPRVKRGVVEQTIDTLRWMGLDWDSGPIIQSDDLPHHHAAMETLASKRLVYPCELTRSQIEAAASAPNEGDHETRFDASLRATSIPEVFHDAGTNWRLIVDPGSIEFCDTFLGNQSFDPSESVGDFVVWTRRECPSYQLAVVVDDHHQGITHIVRGDDLLDSTARQISLQRALGYSSVPTYTHLPLVRGQDGRRLAKRHGDTRIDHYRSSGTTREYLIGLLGYWCGLTSTRTKMSTHDFLAGFDLDTLPREDIIFTPEDDQWLTS
jgi:glutamyl-tRNA synthetase